MMFVIMVSQQHCVPLSGTASSYKHKVGRRAQAGERSSMEPAPEIGHIMVGSVMRRTLTSNISTTVGPQ